MIVLGVDPGTHRTGYAFLEERESRIRVLEYGVIRCKATEALPLRLDQIHRELQALIKVYAPKHCALENIFFAKGQPAGGKSGPDEDFGKVACFR